MRAWQIKVKKERIRMDSNERGEKAGDGSGRLPDSQRR